ncbi:MAG: hypothetical protein M3R60_14190 [Pseudomonadota bacterium]|nr:hypothetical protein [Pseudomonadota bacterium]
MIGAQAARSLCARWWRWLQAVQDARERRGREAMQRARAEQRARTLLLSLLTAEQRAEFETGGYFHVTGGSSGERYRIRADSAVNIDVFGPDGSVRFHLCARPAGNIPMHDVMAGQLLYLQDGSTEARFLAQANRHVTILFSPLDGMAGS